MRSRSVGMQFYQWNMCSQKSWFFSQVYATTMKYQMYKDMRSWSFTTVSIRVVCFVCHLQTSRILSRLSSDNSLTNLNNHLVVAIVVTRSPLCTIC